MATWHEDDSHSAGCAMHVVASAECTCGKLDALGEQDDRCYHVNGGERTVDGWTCDDCGQFFPLGTVVEGERSC